jgi:hypothetical protein
MGLLNSSRCNNHISAQRGFCALEKGHTDSCAVMPRVKEQKAEYIEYLKREIAKRESNRPTMRQFQVRELNGEFSIVWHDDANHCIREGYNRFKTHAEAVNDANSLESGSITPKHWPIIAND